MPGFLIHIGEMPVAFPIEKRKKLVIDRIEGNGYTVQRRVVNKFMNDRVFYEDENVLIVVEGVVLNNHALISKYSAKDWIDCVQIMYVRNGDSFFNEFRGSFSGAYFDKKTGKWLIYTDHTGDKQVFYAETPKGVLFSSEIGFIVDLFKRNGFPLGIDKTGCYLALTHGFCIESRTLIEGVKKLTPGHYLLIQRGEIQLVQYHRFSNTPCLEMTPQEAIEGIDNLFRKAVSLQFEKDKEYGFRHIACLSGGLDSRMTVWVAHQMGYQDQLNITFSQSGHLDFSIAQRIATDLHHDWLFKPLDGGDCIRLIDDVTRITYGSANFFGLANGKGMEDLINYDSFGIIHTGQIGDSIIGSFFKKNEYNKEYKLGQGAYSLELIERLEDYRFEEEYENEEIFCLYTRAFDCADQGLLTFQENSESCSPFLDVDFLEFCYSIPLNLRFRHKIYFDWILQKYPEAAEYIWEKTGQKIQSFDNIPPRYMTLWGYKVPAFGDPAFRGWLKGSILRRLGLRKKGQKAKTIVLNSRNAMTPVDYWYNTNPGLRQFMTTYWDTHVDCIRDEIMRGDMEHLFRDCVVYDKLQSLSVLAAISLISSNEN